MIGCPLGHAYNAPIEFLTLEDVAAPEYEERR
jgi:hypothetical protein